MLVNNGSQITICPTEENTTKPTPDPEPSQPPPTPCTEPAVMPAPETTVELIIALEPKPVGKSDQVHEQETPSVSVGVLMEFEEM